MDAEVTRLPGAPSEHEAEAAASAVPDAAAIAGVFRQVDAAHRRLRTRLAQRMGLTVTDLVALTIVSNAAECTPKLLASELGLTSGSVTALVDRLVDSGQVRREPRAGDRRSILVQLTDAGRATTETISGLYLGAITLALESAPHVFNRTILDSLRSTADALDTTVGAHGDDDGSLTA
jgi:DNA-binding MarR family transcriptional regulator